MNLMKVFSKKQIQLLKENNIDIEDKDLNEEEMKNFCISLFKHNLTQEQQEDFFDTMDDYEDDNI